MAKNRIRERCQQRSFVVPEGTESGDPVVIGQIPGVALEDRGEMIEDQATVQMDGEFELPVTGKNKAGEKAIAEGDIIFLKGGELNVNSEEGVRFGYALAPVVKNKTEVIPVKVGY
jgi:predicted RecA/RadA family phage recombinase